MIAEGLEESKKWINASIELQLELVRKVHEAHGPIELIPYTENVDYQPDVYDAVVAEGRAPIAEAMAIADKNDRNKRLDEIGDVVTATLVGSDEEPGPFAGRAGEVKKALRSLQKEVVRTRIVKEGVRIDGRGIADLRPLSAEVGIIATAHGTGLFQRGETQVLSVTTLGMPRMEQMLDTITTDERKRYMHHYNFAAVLHRRDGPGRLAEAARDRPRRARRARARCPSCRARSSGPTRCASSPTCSRRTAPPRWLRCAAPRWR